MWRDREGTGTGLRDFTCRLHSLQIESGVLRCCSQIRERASATRFTDTPQPSVSRLCGREPKKRRGRAEGEPRKSRGNLAARHQRRRRESGPCANRRGRGFAEVFAKGFRQGRGRAATFNSQAPRRSDAEGLLLRRTLFSGDPQERRHTGRRSVSCSNAVVLFALTELASATISDKCARPAATALSLPE